MSNFVFLYKTYYNFVSSLLFRQQSPQIAKVQADMKFSLVDEVLAIYVMKEKQYARQAVFKVLQSPEQDVVDAVCLIFDTIAKRVSTTLLP